jgi:hypothetical protein
MSYRTRKPLTSSLNGRRKPHSRNCRAAFSAGHVGPCILPLSGHQLCPLRPLISPKAPPDFSPTPLGSLLTTPLPLLSSLLLDQHKQPYSGPRLLSCFLPYWFAWLCGTANGYGQFILSYGLANGNFNFPPAFFPIGSLGCVGQPMGTGSSFCPTG